MRKTALARLLTLFTDLVRSIFFRVPPMHDQPTLGPPESKDWSVLTGREHKQLTSIAHSDSPFRESDIDLMCRAIFSPNGHDRAAAKDAFKRIGRHGEAKLRAIFHATRAAVGSPQWLTLAKATIEAGSEVALHDLRLLHQDVNPRLRRAAIELLLEAWPADWNVLAERSLNDADPDVRSYAHTPLCWRAQKPGLTPAEVGPYLRIVTPLAAGEPPYDANRATAADWMLKADRAQASEILLSSRVLRLDHPFLRDLLFYLSRAHVLVPRTFLEDVLRSGENSDPKSSLRHARTRAIACLAAHEPEAARPLIDQLVHAALIEKIPEPLWHWTTDVADCVLVHAGLPQYAFDFDAQFGAGNDSRERRLLEAVSDMERITWSSGMNNYFRNKWDQPSDCLDAIEGLDMLGMKKNAEIVREAFRLFFDTINAVMNDKSDMLADGQVEAGNVDHEIIRLESMYCELKERTDLRAALFLASNKHLHRPSRLLPPP
jgi:hypothetical protein